VANGCLVFVKQQIRTWKGNAAGFALITQANNILQNFSTALKELFGLAASGRCVKSQQEMIAHTSLRNKHD
jgi:hypothetical protein